MDPTEALLAQWRALTEARWPSAPGGTPLGADALAGLGAAAAAYTRFAQDFARLSERRGERPAPLAAEHLALELGALAERFFTAAVPAGAAAAAGLPKDALGAWSQVLGKIAQDAALRFATRLGAADPPTSLRAAFDAWIDAAESAFQQAAHSEAFVAAQTRLLNEFVAARAAQQALLERGARLAGMPTRADIDALYMRVRTLEQELARARETPAPAPRTRRPRARTR